MKVAQLTIEMAANVARLQKDMAQAQRSVEATMGRIQKSADSAMRALGAIGIGLSVGAFANWIKGAIDAIDRLNDISAATGITVTKLAGLDYAAKLSGTSLDAVTQASNKLQLSLTTNNAALAKVGVTAQDPVEALIQLADAYAATDGQSNKAALGNLALGKSWQSLAGVLAQGGDGLRRLIAEGEALSGVTEETARDAGKFNDEIDKLTTRLGALALNISGPILKVFSEFIDELNEGTKAAGGFWKAIGLLGTTNPFLSLQENVAKYRKQVEELTEKQEKYGEVAALAFGTNEKLATAKQRLAYFEAMLAIETRKSAAALAEGASGANAHVLAYNAMTSSADDLLEQMKQEFSLIGLTNEERAVSIAMRKLEELGMRRGTEVFEKYMKELMEIQKRIGIKREMVRLSEEAAKNAKREGEEYDRLVKSFQEQIAKMQIENETYFAGNAARERAIFLRETENLKIEDRSKLLAQYDEAAAIKAANEARKKGVELQLKQQEDYAKKMEKINDQIGQSLTDALMNGGMNARDFIVNMFKTMVLRPILQPIIGAVTGAVTSLFAGSALAGGTGAAGASSMSQAGSLMGLVGAAKTAYEVVSGGFASVGTAASNLAATFMGQNLAVNAALIESGTIGTAGAALEANALATSQLAGAVGTFAQYAAGIGAGVMAGQMISGKYKVGGSSYLTTGAGAIIGAIVGGPIGAAIGGAIGGVINRAFGMAPKETSSAGFDLTLAATGAITTGFEKWEQKGGWFRSSKSGKEITAVAQDTIDFFNNSAMAVSSSVAGMSKMFGASLDNINNFKLDIVIETLNATKEQIEEQIGGAFKYMETSLVEFLIPNIYEFATAADKTASDILKRLVASVTTVNQAFEVLGYNLYEVSLQGAAASQKIIDLFGGIENFSKSTSFYYENFYTAQEKVNFQTEQLTKIFGALGLTLPETNSAFRQMVESARAAGNDQLFATLVQLAPAFNTLQVALQQLGQTAESTIQTLEKDYASAMAATNKAFDQLKESLGVELEEAIKKAEDNLSRTLALIDDEINATTVTRDLAREAITGIKSVFDLLTNEINDLAGAISITQTSAQARQFISQALETAQRTGYLPSSGELSTAVKQARGGMGSAQYTSEFEMRRDNLRLRNELIFLQEISGEQLSTAELQYENAESQLLVLQERKNQAQIFYENEVAMAQAHHDEQLQAAQDQIDILRGIDNGILSLADAINKLVLALLEEKRAFGSLSDAQSGAGSREQQIAKLYDDILGRAPDADGLRYWIQTGDSIEKIASDIKLSPEYRVKEITSFYDEVLGRLPDAKGLEYWVKSSDSLEKIAEIIAASPEAKGLAAFANGGYYPGGMAMVGERGPELIDFSNPGMVYSNERLRSAMGGGDVATEIRGLREENRIQSRAMVSMQSRMTRMIERWDGDGLPNERYEDATA
jgi:coenzyme F420-reducing hydrogenase delta subunit